jgi:putative hydrolase of HD superfamily
VNATDRQDQDVTLPAAASLRLGRQLAFLVELDKLKHVLRRSYLIGSDRRENSAEHSWHVTVVALVLAEYASDPVDVARVLMMLLLHDVVEIDAGDVPVYDAAGRDAQAEREADAAGRLFGLLPEDQAASCRQLWDEFEAQQTAEARFAKAVDRLMPILQNYLNRGRGWREMAVTPDEVLGVNHPPLSGGAPEIWEYVEKLIQDAAARGFIVGVRPGSDPAQTPNPRGQTPV